MSSQEGFVTLSLPCRSRLGRREGVGAGDDGTGVEHLLELGLDFLFVKFLGTLLEDFLGALAFLADGRLLGEPLHPAIVKKVGAEFLVLLEQRVKEEHQVGALRTVVQAEGILVGVVRAGRCHEVHLDVRIITEVIPSVDADAHREGTGGELLLVGRIAEMGEEDIAQLVAVGVAVHLLVLDNLGHLRLFLGKELVDFAACVGLHLPDDGLVDEIGQDGRHFLLDGRLAGIHFRHEQGDHIVDGGGELLLVFLLQVTYHKEDIDHAAVERLFLLVLDDIECLARVLESPLSQVLHGALYHRAKELVKRNELAHLHILGFTGNRIGDVDERTLVTLHLLVYIVHGLEGVEYLLDELELIGYERIVGHEVVLVAIGLVGAGQDKLRVELGLVLRIHVGQHHFRFAFLVEDTLLRDIFRRSALQGSAYLETSENLSDLILRVGGAAAHVAHHLFQCLLGGAGYPYPRLADFFQPLDQRLEL